ncbi:MAG: ribosome biogenesis GTPase Der [Pseudomonadales bacterium]
MKKPVIALVGRPNVGKSTLFNRLTRSRDALVANYPGLTRDRKYGDASFNEYPVILIDTGGISGEEKGIDAEMAQQSLVAIEESDVVFFLVDGRDGLTGPDKLLADHLRRQDRPVFVLVNKTDGIDPNVALSEFFEMGLGQPYAIAASHGRGVTQLLDVVVAGFEPLEEGPVDNLSGGIKIGVVGRPNVGKSTLVNRMLGEDRVIVYDHPGTTRDSIYIDYERHGKTYTLIDTAGVRKRKNVFETVEKFSIVKTLQAISDANVVLLLIDAQEGLVDQDMHLLGYVIESGRALVVVVNKWDGIEDDQREWIKRELDRRLKFLDYAETHFISALHGSGVGDLYKSVEHAYQAATRKLSTPHLTRILEDAVANHNPPMINGRRIKLRYAHAGGSNPPIIVIHGNQVGQVPDSYKRYLEGIFRKALDISGTPIRILLKGHENPYAGKREKQNSRQEAKRKRLTQNATRARKKPR